MGWVWGRMSVSFFTLGTGPSKPARQTFEQMSGPPTPRSLKETPLFDNPPTHPYSCDSEDAMPVVKNVSYQTIQTHHTDEAASLAFYLNEHGVCAQQVGDTVELPVPDVNTFTKIELLKQTWALFWEFSDSGLFGLPLYIKG